MTASSVERRLKDNAARLVELRDELRVADEQLAHLRDDAEAARVRALVVDNGLALRDHRTAERHAEAMARHRRDLLDDIAKRERRQDELLDELMEGRR